jgi:hypothetical protein
MVVVVVVAREIGGRTRTDFVFSFGSLGLFREGEMGQAEKQRRRSHAKMYCTDQSPRFWQGRVPASVFLFSTIFFFFFVGEFFFILFFFPTYFSNYCLLRPGEKKVKYQIGGRMIR